MSKRPIVAAALLVVLPAAAFAGATAEVQKGVLKVRGDAADDQMAIGPSPTTPGSIRVEALDTLVNGQGFADFAGVKSIDVDLGDGDDLLDVGSVGATRLALKGATIGDSGGTLDLGMLSTTVKGNVTVRLGVGADAVTLGDVAVSGAFVADLDPRAGGGAKDDFGVSNSQIGTLNVFFGPGDETPVIASTTADVGSPCKFKSVILDLGDGNDFLSFNNNDVGTLRIVGGAGDDTCGLLHLTSLGTPAPKLASIDLAMGDGRDIVVVGSSSTPGTTVGKVKFAGGDGNDVLALNNCAVSSTIEGDFGVGNDQFATFAGTFPKTVHLAMGDGDDTLNLLDTAFTGAFVAAGGEGTNDVTQIRGTTSFKLAPALTGFESGETGTDVVIQDDAVPGNKIAVDIATGAYALYLGNEIVSTGAASLKAKGGVLTITSTDAMHPFKATLDVAKHTGKAALKHGTMTTTITDSNTTDSL